MATTVGVVVFPGTNCEMDAVVAVERLGGDGRMLWHADDYLGGVDAVIVPGGFAHGDYLDGLDWDKQPPAPPLPDEVLLATSSRYVEAYERITGRSFADWPGVGG